MYCCSAAKVLGVPEEVHNGADARVIIPISPETRSLNVTVSARHRP